MIHLRVLDEDSQYHMIRSDEPIRVEIAMVDGHIVTHVYRDVDCVPEQDPIARFDPAIGHVQDVKLETGTGPVRHPPSQKY